MSKPPVPKPSKSEQAKNARAAAADGAAVAHADLTPGQRDSFEAAMRLFHTRDLKEARGLFERAAEGPESDVANRARLHMAMCDRRLRQETPELGSAEDYYNYGVALLNTRQVAEARRHLERALQMSPGGDHIHYALAVAQGMAGDTAAAFESLKRAIELEPRNRIAARHDGDLSHLAGQAPFDRLLYPEKKSW